MLVSGADCGPVNPLQGLAKRFEQDRGVQQVCGIILESFENFTEANLLARFLSGLLWSRTSGIIERGRSSIALLIHACGLTVNFCFANI